MTTLFQTHIKKIIAFAVAFYLFVPMVAFGQSSDLGTISTTFDRIIGFINDTLIPLVFAIALLVFLYGVFKYFILGGGDESKRAEGRQLMLYAIIGFVVMVSIFGIVNIIVNGFNINQDSTIDVPNVPGQSRSGGN